jgi:lysophospholipase L1-like esterase
MKQLFHAKTQRRRKDAKLFLSFLCVFVFNFASLRETKASYLALGDSYTIGESEQPAARYPVQAAEMLRAANFMVGEPEIIAVTGWTTADLLNAVKHHPVGAGYGLVTLLIGVNNQYRQESPDMYRKEFTELLQKSLAYAKGNSSSVFVLSIPDYGVTPFAAGSDREAISLGIDEFNAINRQVSESYGVSYINVTEESRKAAGDGSLLARDGLHYAGKEYRIWAALLANAILSSRSLP